MRMRAIAVVMVLLLMSQAGAAIVCTADCTPVASTQAPASHHDHHAMHDAAPAASISAGDCQQLVVFDSALTDAQAAPQFVFAATYSAIHIAVADSPRVLAISTFETSAATSPPTFSVLRI
jgi:hypothetical protein